MNPRVFGLLDMAIVGVPAILFVVWQLVSINREIAKGKATKDGATNDGATKDESPERSRHSIGEHGLDDR